MPFSPTPSGGTCCQHDLALATVASVTLFRRCSPGFPTVKSSFLTFLTLFFGGKSLRSAHSQEEGWGLNAGSGKGGTLVCQGCRDKIADTGRFKPQETYFSQIWRPKSEVKVSADLDLSQGLSPWFAEGSRLAVCSRGRLSVQSMRLAVGI